MMDAGSGRRSGALVELPELEAALHADAPSRGVGEYLPGAALGTLDRGLDRRKGAGVLLADLVNGLRVIVTMRSWHFDIYLGWPILAHL